MKSKNNTLSDLSDLSDAIHAASTKFRREREAEDEKFYEAVSQIQSCIYPPIHRDPKIADLYQVIYALARLLAQLQTEVG